MKDFAQSAEKEARAGISLIRVYASHASDGRRSGILVCGERYFPCLIGRGGIVQSKREGDGCSPAGLWHCRRLFYRPDRIGKTGGIETPLPQTPLSPDDIWCDDPTHPHYNHHGTRTSPAFLHADGTLAHHEALWRDDGVYDLIIVLGYNDAPVVAGLGSAIFIHLMASDRRSTAGCIALTRHDFLWMARHIAARSFVHISPVAYKGSVTVV